jgi:dihydrofolate synthase/folylpolyglutamate synthase
MTWTETEKYLNSISQRGMKPGLQRMRELMRILDHPEEKFRSIHVAGTNGKGSVCAMLESILRSSGLATGLYTSPHLLDPRERITLCGKMIDPDEVSYWVDRIRRRAGDFEPELTYFEMFTAVALCAFAQKKVDMGIFEAGLGGRLDATNILPRPEVCVITNIGLEHTDVLGGTVQKIAREKAGIVKKGSVCVTGASGHSLKAILEICREKGSKAVIAGENRLTPLKKLAESCRLKGEFQKRNISIVLKTVRVLREKKWAIPDAALQRGLREVAWPGRFDEKHIRLGSRKTDILLDGAHNPHAVRNLLLSVAKTKLKDRSCSLVFNSLRDKNIPAMVRNLARKLKIRRVFIPSLDTPRTQDPEFTKTAIECCAKKAPVEIYPSVASLWTRLKNCPETLEKDWVLVTGSLYLIGETLRELDRIE